MHPAVGFSSGLPCALGEPQGVPAPRAAALGPEESRVAGRVCSGMGAASTAREATLPGDPLTVGPPASRSRTGTSVSGHQGLGGGGPPHLAGAAGGVRGDVIH